MFILISGSHQPKHRRVTHSPNASTLVNGSDLLSSRGVQVLDVFSIYLISKTHYHFSQSYQFALQKIVNRLAFHKPNFHSYILTFCITCQSQMIQVKIINDIT